MLSQSEFEILVLIEKTEKQLTQREIASETDIALGKVNRILTELKNSLLISGDNRITDEGRKTLEPFRVTNAIIMAAGMSSRFAPLSYESPKALLKVKGDILIEREIEQLHTAGINNITLVVGYMKEKLFYLEEKYGVKIVINEDYYKYNNTSTLVRVLDELDNTYICSSDNYFTINPFEKYVYQSYYSAVYAAGKTDEYCIFTNKTGRINEVTFGGSDAWYMLGHVYWNRDFSKKFCEILKREYDNPITKEQLWENLYVRYIDELDMYIRKYDTDFIKEFDSLDELREFDESYLKDSNSEVIDNICNVLNCENSDVESIVPIKEGLTNLSFRFEVKGHKYVYRHPGVGTEVYINRFSEAKAMAIASKLGLDKTFIYMDPEKGWKISHYIEDAHTLDYHDPVEVEKAIKVIRTLHSSNEKTEFEFDYFAEIRKFLELLEPKHKASFNGMDKLISDFEQISELLSADDYPKCLCHCDCYSPNFLFDKDGKIYLIDWEYAGMSDPGCDLGTFVVCSDYDEEEGDAIIRKYLGDNYTDADYRHMNACFAVSAFYWFVWALYQDSLGKLMGEYLYTWYKYSVIYSKKTLKLYEGV